MAFRSHGSDLIKIYRQIRSISLTFVIRDFSWPWLFWPFITAFQEKPWAVFPKIYSFSKVIHIVRSPRQICRIEDSWTKPYFDTKEIAEYFANYTFFLWLTKSFTSLFRCRFNLRDHWF
uniref:Uncharacterized protein n=1 Tax=Lepeophtheirus salmonis TaxID=72036 RepID=A0A0K2UB23_LEPSM